MSLIHRNSTKQQVLVVLVRQVCHWTRYNRQAQLQRDSEEIGRMA
jgi:hypothetical protein